MSVIDKIIIVYTIGFFIHSVVFLLYQFEVVGIAERQMGCWIRFSNIVETVFLVLIHTFTPSRYGKWCIAAFYLLSILLLVLQLIFAEGGLGQKILDAIWIGFYVILFAYDICGIGLAEMISCLTELENFKLLNNFLKNTFVGDIVLGVLIPVLRAAIIQVMQREE